MTSHAKLDEVLKPGEGFQDLDISLGNIDSSVFLGVADTVQVGALASCGAVANTETMTVTLLQATDAAGTGKKVLGTAKVATNSTGGAATLVAAVAIEVSQMDIAGGFTFFCVRMTSNGVGVIPARAVLVSTPKDKPPA